ncbi:CAF1 family ribonuclease [Histoplasma capsulatum]|uniref:CAF1 family ribonuclease n=1 Tax=Ajellomyces capsulatus TaxID=5037 RepID=A0A8A1M5E7_AJECA|nr:CAF1 family ribonuclease [Histoplasma capsulatum]
MDVTKQSFSQHLPRLLNDLAESTFVALDLEFSGIVARQSGPSPGSDLWGEKQTLQERYEEVKYAAETYQVLQIGLTFAREDTETGQSDRVQLTKLWGLKDDGRIKAVDKEDYLNIPEPCPLENGNTESPLGSWRFSLNSYQKRLVHQLVRVEYPSLVSIGRQTFVQIIPYDKQREESIRVDKSRALRERVIQKTGFRWVVEGMVGGGLSAMDPRVFLSCISNPAPVNTSTSALLSYSDDLQLKLKSRQPVLVGHNLFTDLINFYKCFIGDLPDRIEDFKNAIHALFPLVIDTKYMATHNCSSMTPSSSLTEINDKLEQRRTPRILLDPEHDKYADEKPLHEAGYDSLLTAKVLIRLAAELLGEGTISSPSAPPITESIVLDSWPRAPLKTTSSIRKRIENKGEKLIDVDEPDCSDSKSFSSSTSVMSIFNRPPIRKDKSTPKQAPVDWRTESEVCRIRSLFSEQPADGENGTLKSQLLSLDSNSPFRKLREKAVSQRKRQNSRLIPPFSDDFWDSYGNKLRVFGTLEEICDLK